MLLLLPYLAAAGSTCLRFFASEETVLEQFYTERELAEDQLIDALILAGSRMAPRLDGKSAGGSYRAGAMRSRRWGMWAAVLPASR